MEKYNSKIGDRCTEFEAKQHRIMLDALIALSASELTGGHLAVLARELGVGDSTLAAWKIKGIAPAYKPTIWEMFSDRCPGVKIDITRDQFLRIKKVGDFKHYKAVEKTWAAGPAIGRDGRGPSDLKYEPVKISVDKVLEKMDIIDDISDLL